MLFIRGKIVVGVEFSSMYVLTSYYTHSIPQLFFSPNQLALWMIHNYIFCDVCRCFSQCQIAYRLRKKCVVLGIDKKSKQQSLLFYFFNNNRMYCRCTFLIQFYYCCCLEQPFRNLWSSDKQMKKNSSLFLLTLLYIYKDIRI